MPGSLAIDGAAQSDAARDDRAEFDAGGGRVVARLGSGANATTGGTLAVGGAVTTVTFRVRIGTGGVPAGATIANRAQANFTAATNGQQDAGVETAPAETRVLALDLAMFKQHDPAFVSGGRARSSSASPTSARASRRARSSTPSPTR
jgi:hypothetical protein